MKRQTPIRVKFMLTFLLVVTTVLAVNTFSTANLFQEDKQAYVNGLTSMVALGMAEEARSTFIGYTERLRLYSRMALEGNVSDENRKRLSQTLFEETPELISVTTRRPGQEPVEIYNIGVLEAAGLGPSDLKTFTSEHPLPVDSIDLEQTFVRNTTLAKQLPCFTMAFKHVIGDESEPVLVVAVLDSGHLLKLVSRFSAYDQFLTDSEGTVLAHSNRELVTNREPAELGPEAEAVHDEFSAEITLEYSREGTEMIGGFASLDFGGIVAGAEIPRSAAHLASKTLVNRQLLLAAVLLIGAVLCGVAWAFKITGPMERLSRATRTIAGGDFDVRVNISARDELGDLATSFNKMAGGLKEREEELHDAHQQLVQSEKLAAFGQLGAGIAHEVKNPLAGILACAQMAAEEVQGGSQVHDDLKLIEKETRRCKSIIDNLLKFARQEKTEMTPTSVNEVIEDSIAIVRHQLEINEVRVEEVLLPDLPVIQGNANQLQQVFINLLINAQHAMQGTPGSMRVESRVAENGAVEVWFTDTGPGIPEDVRVRIFEPFFTTKATGDGTGLGLSVSFGIIADHGGEIQVESEMGQGTTFIITLPCSEKSSEVLAGETVAVAG